MTWNHRVIRHVLLEDTWLAIHEVHYDEDGEPNGCTKEPIQIIQEDLDAIKWEIDKIKSALEKPVIDFSFFEEQERKIEEQEKKANEG